MTSIDQDVWSKLTRPSGEKLVARPGFPELTPRLLYALDSSASRHLLIHLQPDNEEIRDVQSRGLSVTTRELVVQGRSPERYVDIECLDSAGHPVLDLMGRELAEQLGDEEKQPAESVKQVLSKWRRFWGQIPRQVLTKQEQLGLFAELWFLSKWLMTKSSVDIIMAWRGPWGSRHDFEWPDKSVEVKATSNSRGRIHRINGLDQLESAEGAALYLFSLSLREEGGAPNTLPALVENCRSQLAESSDASARFETGLVQAGYAPMHEEEYSKVHLRIVEEVLFSVEGDFPRLTKESLEAGVTPGVERVEYEINLNTFNHLIRATKPQEFSA